MEGSTLETHAKIWYEGKISTKIHRAFKSVKRIGPVAYWLALPLHLANIHDVFHLLTLSKAKVNLSRVLPQVLLEIEENITLKVKLVKVLDRCEKELRNKKISMIKVL